MRVATGKVVAGKVVIEGAPFEEGTSVTVIAAEDNETFELGPKDEAAILAAIAEADRGEVVDGVELIAKLGSRD
jgi:predicted transcriptional regulator